MNIWHLDMETYSECDIGLGSYKYACDPSTRILLAAIALNDGPVYLWDSTARTSECLPALNRLIQMCEDDGIVISHSVGFEIPISYQLFPSTFGLEPPALERWRCTMAMARRACIPQSLRDCAKFLKLDEQKADCGKQLIKYFSIPMEKEPRNYKVDGKVVTREQAWKMFGEYCRQDVETERAIWHKLKPFHLDNHPLVRDSFLLDLRLNHRGVPVNLKTLQHANGIVQRAMAEVNKEFVQITGLNVTQTVKVTEWMKERGYKGENLQALTMEQQLERTNHGMTPEAYRALRLRAGGSFAAIAKIPTMLEVACPDGRARGQFWWWGATTGRWVSKGVQVQNFKRPTIKDTHLAYEMLKWGADEEALEMTFGEVPETLSSCIRHFIEAEGEEMLDGDFANIEARITPWLVGEDDMLEEFRRGEDIYKKMAAFIFSVPESKVTKDQRFVGKQACLGAQYSIGWKKFQKLCANYKKVLDEETCKLAVSRYREKRTRIVSSWRELTDAAHEAIRNSGKRVVSNRCTFIFGKLGADDFYALQVILPSGRKLTYPLAHLKMALRRLNEEDEWVRVPYPKRDGDWELEEIRYWGKSKTSTAWGWQATFGGRVLENLVQGIAGDFLSHTMLLMESRGIDPFMTVHDQVLALKNGHSVETFQECMTTLPDWSSGFPLEASCSITPYYTKED